MTVSDPKYCIVATAKNEAPFLVEWIAHHLSIGFDKIFIATNDCDDKSNEIIQAIGTEYPVYHVENTPPYQGITIQTRAVNRCLKQPEIADQDWAFHIDIDEFLNIHTGEPNVASFMKPFQDYDAVLIFWKRFGDNGRSFWDGGSVLDTFLTCGDDPLQSKACKVMFRTNAFGSAAPHCPKKPFKPMEELRAVTTEHKEIDLTPLLTKWKTSLVYDDSDMSWAGACLNHYTHKSHDLTLMSRLHRGDANGRENIGQSRRTLGSREYKAANQNTATDNSIQRTRQKRLELMNAFLKLPSVRKNHYLSQLWFYEKILQSEGETLGL